MTLCYNYIMSISSRELSKGYSVPVSLSLSLSLSLSSPVLPPVLIILEVTTAVASFCPLV